MECEFCQKIFSTKGTLKTHQKTAKYCIKLQEKKGNNIEKFFCQYCNKELSQRQVIFHEQKCEKFILIEKDNIIEKLKLEIKKRDDIIEKLNLELKDEFKHTITRFENLAIKGIEKSTKTVNNNLNFLQPLTDEYLRAGIDQLTKEHIMEGEDGIVRHFIETVNEKYITCTDPSRAVFKIKEEDGKIVKDIRAEKTLSRYSNSATPKVAEIAAECKNELLSQIEENPELDSLEIYKAAVNYDLLKRNVENLPNPTLQSGIKNKIIGQIKNRIIS